MVGELDALVNRAGAAISSSEHLSALAVQEPRVLLRVLQHLCDAIAQVSQALLATRDIETTDSVRVLKILRATGGINIPGCDAALSAWESSMAILKDHRDATMVFVRGRDLILADDRFGMRRVSLDEIEQHIVAARLFVYRASKQVMLR